MTKRKNPQDVLYVYTATEPRITNILKHKKTIIKFHFAL